jgi:hypothetical protein
MISISCRLLNNIFFGLGPVCQVSKLEVKLHEIIPCG